jgi:hypothetical protein
MIKKPGNFGKSRVFWKKPYFFFKRLKLDHLRKSRAFSKKALLFPEKALLFRLKLRTLLLTKKIRGKLLAAVFGDVLSKNCVWWGGGGVSVQADEINFCGKIVQEYQCCRAENISFGSMLRGTGTFLH